MLPADLSRVKLIHVTMPTSITPVPDIQLTEYAKQSIRATIMLPTVLRS